GRRWGGSRRPPSRCCREAPNITAPTACLRPVWASEMTSCTPASPRAFNEGKKGGQKAPSAESPTSKPEHLAAAVAGDSGGDHHRLGDDPVVDPGLAVGGVEKDIRIAGLGERAVTECRHFHIEVGADPRHL